VLRSLVVKNGEVLLLQTSNRRPGLRRHNDIKVDSGGRGRGWLGVVLGEEYGCA
jgi:hypothetical protein